MNAFIHKHVPNEFIIPRQYKSRTTYTQEQKTLKNNNPINRSNKFNLIELHNI